MDTRLQDISKEIAGYRTSIEAQQSVIVGNNETIRKQQQQIGSLSYRLAMAQRKIVSLEDKLRGFTPAGKRILKPARRVA